MSLKPDNSPQIASPSYRLPAMDLDYMMGDTMRGVRFLVEYAKAEELLRDWGVASTVVVFGSARVNEGTPWYETAREFARIVSQRGGAKLNHEGPRQNVIATGGGPGIMEAANRGAMEAGAPSIGFNITLPHEQEPNAYSTPALTFRFHYFAMRKMHLAMRAAALVVFPGGFGTMDELFEILTLRQTGKMPALPVVLVDSDYWNSVINFQAFVDHGMVSPADLELFQFADDAESAWSCLTRNGIVSYPEFRHVAEGDR
ncbi:MAG: TIGR00730 family Rossman fold protein [Aestuariivirgaceae bacterium]|nr:TIGR00730 family Rossman fold protein [Aestuariivirgaceae bacterium]